MMSRPGVLRRESSEEGAEGETEEEDWDAEDLAATVGPGVGVYGSGAGVNNASSTSAHPTFAVLPHPNAPFSAHPNSSASTSTGTGSGTPYGPNANASGSHVVLGSPGLLARIGSVKRWGFGGGGGGDKGRDGRRKKSSSVSVGSVGLGEFFFSSELDFFSRSFRVSCRRRFFARLLPQSHFHLRSRLL